MKRKGTIGMLVAAALVAALAAEPARAGIFDGIAGKIKGDLEEKARKKAEEMRRKAEAEQVKLEQEATNRIERAVGDVVNGAADAADRATGAVPGAVEGVVDGASAAVGRATGAVEGAIDAAADGATVTVEPGEHEAASGGSASPSAKGPFFQPPPGVSSRAELSVLQRPHPGAASRDYVQHLRNTAQDAYYGFWGYWFGQQEQYATYLNLMRAQRAQLLRFGAVREAEELELRIATLEAELRVFVSAPLEKHMARVRPNPLITFGLDLETVPRDAILQAMDALVGMLGLVAMSAASDEALQSIEELARDATRMRAALESDDLATAQRIMDRRWAWVMAR